MSFQIKHLKHTLQTWNRGNPCGVMVKELDSGLKVQSLYYADF